MDGLAGSVGGRGRGPNSAANPNERRAGNVGGNLFSRMAVVAVFADGRMALLLVLCHSLQLRREE